VLRQVGLTTAVLLSIVLLNVSLAFTNIWPTPKIHWDGHLSAEVAFAVFGLMAVRWLGGGETPIKQRRHLSWLAGAWVALVLGRYLDVMAPALYGRDVNLYWDSRHLPAVFAMMTTSVPLPLLVGGCLTILAVVVWSFWLMRAAWRLVALGVDRTWDRRVLGFAAAATLVLWGGQQAGALSGKKDESWVTPTVVQSYWRQGRILVTQLATRQSAIVESQLATQSDLRQVDGADVYLVFVESYGAVTYDRPTVASVVERGRAEFEAAVKESGRQVVSAFVESPTFAGSSWLAHVTLMSGVETRNEDTNAVLMSQQRDTLVTTFQRQGYRTIALMPGLTFSWPEGTFYRFDRIYNEREMEYNGPHFSWWEVPDQFALARLDTLEQLRKPGPRPRRFVFFPTTSTHAPFGPTAPYQPDWTRFGSSEPYDEDAVAAALAKQPDWLDLSPSYADSMNYAYASIGGYLRLNAGRDLVMVMLGDHQPAAAVAGEGASWDVPVHIIASRPELLDRFIARGFRTGMHPPRQAISKMHELLPTLLEVFGSAPIETTGQAAAVRSARNPG
jgi:phosphoglycerol transferase MdoB-like AlkP superfamily enzyme